MALNPGFTFRLLLLAGLLCLSLAASAEIVLTENDKGRVADKQPAPGTLVIPGEKAESKSGEEKCMTVCARWGEECTYINRGPGGMTRKCRRTCKQFTEECF